ncbi:MAG TPA: hypothetical protein V6C69_16945 [Trichormus sp.]|jgi:hypothetical protein
MSTVSWGKRERYKSASCGALVGWAPPVISAVYAMTYKQEPKKSRNNIPFSTLVSPKIFPAGTDFEKGRERLDEDGTLQNLYVFVHPMTGSTKFERTQVHNRLVTEYQPHVNEM